MSYLGKEIQYMLTSLYETSKQICFCWLNSTDITFWSSTTHWSILDDSGWNKAEVGLLWSMTDKHFHNSVEGPNWQERQISDLAGNWQFANILQAQLQELQKNKFRVKFVLFFDNAFSMNFVYFHLPPLTRGLHRRIITTPTKMKTASPNSARQVIP